VPPKPIAVEFDPSSDSLRFLRFRAEIEDIPVDVVLERAVALYQHLSAGLLRAEVQLVFTREDRPDRMLVTRLPLGARLSISSLIDIPDTHEVVHPSPQAGS
jgi:hypothetical protein